MIQKKNIYKGNYVVTEMGDKILKTRDERKSAAAISFEEAK